MWITKIRKPIIALAPMADMTDSPFCRVCREVEKSRKYKVKSKKFVVFREMVSSEAVVRGNEKTLKMCEFEEVERPIVLQLFGADAKVMRKATEIIVERFKPDGIDINMGCPVPKIAKKNQAGAALMKDHDRACEIVRELKKAKLGVPISVKTRLGWASDEEILEFAPKLEQAGADLISIHGRTKKQGYAGKANWERIGEVKKLLSIPVLANGDIKSREDIDKCLEVTGADGVMIGRAVLGNPWLLAKSEIINHKSKIGISGIVEVVLRHAELHEEHYRSLVSFRKHLVYYFKGVPGVKQWRQELVKVNNLEDLKNILQKITT
ncbi:tRNA-dihydrouridine synthase [Patescibacteria group bacterium]|nr:tRNA-dihydrouridine synthase [Patescibacteria group bacterium]